MKKEITLICSVFFILSIYAQKPVVKVSPEYKTKEGRFDKYLANVDGDNIMLFSTSYAGRADYWIKTFGKNFNEISSKKLVTDSKDSYWYFLESNRKNLLLGTGVFDKKEDLMKLNITTLDFRGNSVNTVEIGKFESTKRNRPSVKFLQSTDSSKMASIIFPGIHKSEDKVSLYACVMNEKLEKTWSRVIEFDFNYKYSTIVDYQLLNNGDMFFLTRESDSKRSSKKVDGERVANYEIKLYKVSDNGSKPKEMIVDLGGDFLKGGKLVTDEKGNTYYVGFWSKEEGGLIQGSFVLGLNKDGGKISTNKTEFDSKTLDEMAGNKENNKEKKKGDEGLDAKFVFQKLDVANNGDIEMICEERYQYTVCSQRANGGQSCYTNYVGNDILNIKLDNQGKIKKVVLIPKSQTANIENVVGYSMFEANNQRYFIYNENKNNINEDINNQKKVRNSFSLGKTVPALTTLKSDGKLTRTELFGKNDDVDYVFLPDCTKQINNKTFFICLAKFKFLSMYSMYQFAFLTIPESNPNTEVKPKTEVAPGNRPAQSTDKK